MGCLCKLTFSSLLEKPIVLIFIVIKMREIREMSNSQIEYDILYIGVAMQFALCVMRRYSRSRHSIGIESL